MKIELRNIKTNERLSDETNCYSATLYIDGKLAGEVCNRGCGGPDEQHLKAGYDIKTINEWLAANEAPMSMAKYNMEDVPCDLEMHCGRIVAVQQELRRFRRLCKSNVVVVDGDDIRTFHWKGVKQVGANHIAQIKQKMPARIIVNELSETALIDFIAKLAA